MGVLASATSAGTPTRGWRMSATAPASKSSAPCSRRSSPLQQEDKAELGDYEARIKVFHECTITDLIKEGGPDSRAFGYWRERSLHPVRDPAVVMATAAIGKSYKVTSNSWEYTATGMRSRCGRARR